MTAAQIKELFAHLPDEHLSSFNKSHSWCSALQLYHLYKLKGKDEFEEQARKTALFFQNTHWLNWQLLQLEKDSSISSADAEKGPTKIEVAPENEAFLFEPMHMVDYFGSQGIKITEEPMTDDKIGKQLKSFTEWLKSMKKIHVQSIPADENTDKKIQHIAEGSNKEPEVLTEAMAEVLEKQGKNAKAIELYTKLSLTDPSKSAYFAAQIERLKTS